VALAASERAAGLGAGAVERLARRRDEPAWLHERRLAAWQEYELSPAPRWQRGIKGWWRLDLTNLNLRDLRPPAPTSTIRRSAAPEGAAAVVRWQESGVEVAVAGSWAERGLYVADMATAVRERPELVRGYLDGQSGVAGDRLLSLAAAFWTAGVFVFTPAGLEVELPVEVITNHARPGALLGWRTVVVAEQGSSVVFAEEFPGADDGGGLLGALSEVYVGPGARVTYATLAGHSAGTTVTAQRRATIGQDGFLNWFAANWGGTTVKEVGEVRLAGQRARLEMTGAFVADAEQQFDGTVTVVHDSKQSAAEILLRGVVKDTARAAFAGTIKVPAGAQQVESHLASHTLTLSDQARVDVVPSLEIAANDVRVGHGAAAGKLDEEQVFYLMSRGLSREQATRLLVRGFLEPALSRLPLPAARARVERAVEGKI
jgi:Fe-S cluster assembly protein SufD